MEEDVKWVREVLKGNQQEFAHIIDKYKNPLYATILRMTKNPQDAQDFVQEAFLKIYHQLDKYKETGTFSSWLYRVAINHCLDEFRKKRLETTSTEFAEHRAVDRNHPEVVYLKKERQRQLERLIATLPEDERLIVLLRYANECSYEEISELAGMPLSTVRNKLHRAKKKMRNTVKREGGNFHELSNDR